LEWQGSTTNETEDAWILTRQGRQGGRTQAMHPSMHSLRPSVLAVGFVVGARMWKHLCRVCISTPSISIYTLDKRGMEE
jgi:hypothetical protein